MRTKTIILLLISLSAVPLTLSSGQAAVDWNIERTLKLDSPPLDMALSLNGKWIYVLTDQGTLLIYTSAGRLEDKIQVGKHIDQIQVGAQEDILLMKSRQRMTVEVLSIDFIRKINISGSPFKGPANAPVVIVVFSEFQ